MPIQYFTKSCGSLDTEVASDSWGPRFLSSHQQKLNIGTYYQSYWRDENKEKRGWKRPIQQKQYFTKRVSQTIANLNSANFT